jgi:hypothetical protein
VLSSGRTNANHNASLSAVARVRLADFPPARTKELKEQSLRQSARALSAGTLPKPLIRTLVVNRRRWLDLLIVNALFNFSAPNYDVSCHWRFPRAEAYREYRKSSIFK